MRVLRAVGLNLNVTGDDNQLVLRLRVLLVTAMRALYAGRPGSDGSVDRHAAVGCGCVPKPPHWRSGRTNAGRGISAVSVSHAQNMIRSSQSHGQAVQAFSNHHERGVTVTA